MIIGKTVRVITDSTRREPFSGENKTRRIVISVFYPSDEAEGMDREPEYADLFHPCADKA